MIEGAAGGEAAARHRFAAHYGPVLRGYLTARWSRSPLQPEVDDAMQEIFVECYKAGGALQRVEAGRSGGFRGFLYGVARNVALRFEEQVKRRQQGDAGSEFRWQELAARDATLSQVFDRSWAQQVMGRAAQVLRQHARQKDSAAERRVELLELRFAEGLPIRAIAERWQVKADWLHHQYATARSEFRRALLEVMSFYHPDSEALAEAEAQQLVELLEES